MDSPMFSIQQVAEKLGVSSDLVRDKIKLRKLKAVDFGNGKHACYRVKQEWIDDFVKECELPPLKKIVKQNENLRPSKFATIKSFPDRNEHANT